MVNRGEVAQAQLIAAARPRGLTLTIHHSRFTSVFPRHFQSSAPFLSAYT